MSLPIAYPISSIDLRKVIFFLISNRKWESSNYYKENNDTGREDVN